MTDIKDPFSNGMRCESCNKETPGEAQIGVQVQMGESFRYKTCTMYLCQKCHKERESRKKNEK